MKCDICEREEASYMFNKTYGVIVWNHKQIDYICNPCLKALLIHYSHMYWIAI